MPTPDFTPDERYLIAYMKSREPLRWNFFMWAYLVVGLAWFGFGVYYESMIAIFVGFGIYCIGRIYEERYQQRYGSVWKSIIEKFEAVCTESDGRQSTANS